MIQVVCGLICDDSGRVLACRRPFDKHLGGFWEFPGGKVEANESPDEALRRELQEELAIQVVIGDSVGEPVRWADKEVQICLTAFWCTIVSGSPVAIEHEELKWVTVSTYAELSWAEADLPFLDEFVARFS